MHDSELQCGHDTVWRHVGVMQQLQASFTMASDQASIRKSRAPCLTTLCCSHCEQHVHSTWAMVVVIDHAAHRRQLLLRNVSTRAVTKVTQR